MFKSRVVVSPCQFFIVLESGLWSGDKGTVSDEREKKSEEDANGHLVYSEKVSSELCAFETKAPQGRGM